MDTVGGETYNGTWTVNDVTVTYSYTGTVPADATALPADITDAHINDVINLTTPTATGYTFDGWVVTGAASQTATDFTVGTDAITVEGSWTANTHTISFSAGLGVFADSSNLITTNVDFDSEIATPQEPTRLGYTFAGWVDGDDNAVTFPMTLTEDANLTFTATWTAATLDYTVRTHTMNTDGATYAIADVLVSAVTDSAIDLAGTAAVTAAEGFTFDAGSSNITGINDGTLVLDVYFTRNQYTLSVDNMNGDAIIDTDYYYGAAVTAPAEPTRSGYTFVSWDIAAPATMPAEDVLLRAMWELNNYSITYSYATTPAGASALPANVTDAHMDDVVAIPAAPTAPGYTFAGWIVTGAASQTATDFTIGTQNITVVGSWTVNSYNVSFVVDGVTVSGPTATEFGSIIVKPADPTPAPGYYFGGWYTEVNGGGTVAPANMPANDATYYAYWTTVATANYYMDIYLAQLDGTYAATPTVSIQSVGATNSTVSMTPFAQTGFTIDNANSVLSGTIAPDGQFRLVARYTRNEYTVNFLNVDNDGANIQSTFYYGETIVVPDIDDVTGSVFTGWDAAIPATMPASALNFTAQWDVTDYTVTYVVNGVTNTATYNYGDTINIADPVVPGYTFTGWTPALPATMPAQNIFVTATFSGASYTVTFLDASGNTFFERVVPFGTPITLPATTPTKQYYTFLNWIDVPATMPGNNIQISPNFAPIAITLIPESGSTTVIDPQDEADPTDANIIYGIPANINITESDLLNEYLDYTGNGRIEIIPAAVNQGVSLYGTGTTVNLYNASTNELIATYYIVIFGDVNGDARIDNSDVTAVNREVAGFTSWSRTSSAEYRYCTYRAANIGFGGGAVITSSDASVIKYIFNYMATVDQATGTVTAI